MRIIVIVIMFPTFLLCNYILCLSFSSLLSYNFFRLSHLFRLQILQSDAAFNC